MEPLLESIANDLPVFGYTAASQKQDLDGHEIEILVCTHPTKPHFWVMPLGEGAFFRALFRLGQRAETDAAGLLGVLNDCNTRCIAARCFRLGTKNLAIGGWYPRPYDRTGFGVFFEQCQQDMRMVFGLEGLRPYYSSGDSEGA
jgi:hypothetical protein